MSQGKLYMLSYIILNKRNIIYALTVLYNVNQNSLLTSYNPSLLFSFAFSAELFHRQHNSAHIQLTDPIQLYALLVCATIKQIRSRIYLLFI